MVHAHTNAHKNKQNELINEKYGLREHGEKLPSIGHHVTTVRLNCENEKTQQQQQTEIEETEERIRTKNRRSTIK